MESADWPTVYPHQHFNHVQDAEDIEKAVKGKGCDEQAVIDILCNRTFKQRQAIAQAYEQRFRKELISVLKSETSGDFEDVIVTLMQSPALNDAIMLHDAVKGKDHTLLNTIAFTRTNEQLHQIQEVYRSKFNTDAVEDVRKVTNGAYEQLLVACLSGGRDQEHAERGYDVLADARALFESGPKRPGTNMGTYVGIFATRSFVHLRKVFQRFQMVAKMTIEQAVIDEMKGDDEKGFLALIKVIKNKAEFFCDQLVGATKGLGTNEKKLNFVIVSRSEVDLGRIADEYQRLHKQSLEKLIEAETSGDYKKALLALARGNAIKIPKDFRKQ
ncbi:annexin A2-like [Paramacrobiotus metropolitanus]|uniref:annexin A2-like n=1 Tax=Paramacrobiotus metropolitanus TaxID=2943436 RepID=UPI00244610D1|nr:annexin A2-like [Paramacrobiotus metropolitanus]